MNPRQDHRHPGHNRRSHKLGAPPKRVYYTWSCCQCVDYNENYQSNGMSFNTHQCPNFGLNGRICGHTRCSNCPTETHKERRSDPNVPTMNEDAFSPNLKGEAGSTNVRAFQRPSSPPSVSLDLDPDVKDREHNPSGSHSNDEDKKESDSDLKEEVVLPPFYDAKKSDSPEMLANGTIIAAAGPEARVYDRDSSPQPNIGFSPTAEGWSGEHAIDGYFPEDVIDEDTAKEWEEVKGTIQQRYIDEGRTSNDLRAIVQTDLNFSSTLIFKTENERSHENTLGSALYTQDRTRMHTKFVHDEDASSDLSGLSGASSIASIAESLFSRKSGSSMSSLPGPPGAGERLVAFLLIDDTIKPLCVNALAKISREDVEKKLRRLLKEFGVDLRKEATTIDQRRAAHFVRFRARNSAHMICNTLKPDLKPTLSSLPLVKPLEADVEVQDDSCDSDSFDEEEVDDLQQLEAFIKTSAAIMNLRRALRAFIYPIKAQIESYLRGEQTYPARGLCWDGLLRDRIIQFTVQSTKNETLRITMDRSQTIEQIVSHVRSLRGAVVDWKLLCFEADQSEDGTTIVLYDIDAKNISHQMKEEQAFETFVMNKDGQSFRPYDADLCPLVESTRQPTGILKVFARLGKTYNSTMRTLKPPLDGGKVRVEWQCGCGHRSFDDFVELKPGAAERYRRKINSSNPSSFSPRSSTFSNITLSGALQSLRSIWMRRSDKGDGPGLPLHDRQTPESQLDNGISRPHIPARAPQEHLYLLLCYSQGRYGTRLLQLDLVELQAKSDKALFNILRSNYRSMRGGLWSFLSFRTLCSIKFVYFQMCMNELVDVRKPDDIPPPENRDYRYQPAPSEIIPPVGERLMMHLFKHPDDHVKEESFCLDRFPKKLKEKLKCSGGVARGWGLQFVEGWDETKISFIGYVFFGLGSLLAGVLWAIYGHNIQTAFAVASYVLTFATLTVGTMQNFFVM